MNKDNILILYCWFLVNKMSMHVDYNDIYFSGIWGNTKYQDEILHPIFDNEIIFLKKYAVNK